MKHKTLMMLSVATFIASTNTSFANGTPYVGGSLGFGGYNSQPDYLANIFGGYGMTFGRQQKFYLGGELNVHVGHYNATNYGLGVSIMPGLKLSDTTMIYTRLGLDSSYLPNRNSYQVKPQLGLGIQTELTKKIDLRGEFVTSGPGATGSYNLGLVYKFD